MDFNMGRVRRVSDLSYTRVQCVSIKPTQIGTENLNENIIHLEETFDRRLSTLIRIKSHSWIPAVHLLC